MMDWAIVSTRRIVYRSGDLVQGDVVLLAIQCNHIESKGLL